MVAGARVSSTKFVDDICFVYMFYLFSTRRCSSSSSSGKKEKRKKREVAWCVYLGMGGVDWLGWLVIIKISGRVGMG